MLPALFAEPSFNVTLLISCSKARDVRHFALKKYSNSFSEAMYGHSGAGYPGLSDNVWSGVRSNW